ncbi:hypothetical protein Val02_08270 [Virgisporangium aliadipatigenens]|uniref:Response regulatory domain-containing protein n=1 Tax=Virgisporangium aliadipatigenens TaxID=741659 RepID=A0A8J3YHA6_9ACTN|nr:response regulator [Virgisporangium aliadipatigenens]GIJ43941.1 hypothetical protein Val02_08270 [Virgisporangium aliadipatigenens]
MSNGLSISLPSLDDLRQPNILVVDDDADLRELLELKLTSAGYRVDTAANGEAALARIAKRLPDLVVLDVMMPGLSGVEVCKELRADGRTRSLPIVMLTARAHVMFESEGMMAGADLYLTKPFSPRTLLARIEELLTF